MGSSSQKQSKNKTFLKPPRFQDISLLELYLLLGTMIVFWDVLFFSRSSIWMTFTTLNLFWNALPSLDRIPFPKFEMMTWNINFPQISCDIPSSGWIFSVVNQKHDEFGIWNRTFFSTMGMQQVFMSWSSLPCGRFYFQGKQRHGTATNKLRNLPGAIDINNLQFFLLYACQIPGVTNKTLQALGIAKNPLNHHVIYSDIHHKSSHQLFRRNLELSLIPGWWSWCKHWSDMIGGLLQPHKCWWTIGRKLVDNL